MNKTRDFFRKYMGYLAIALVSVCYVLTALLEFIETGKTAQQIIADGTLVFLLGFFINRLFDLQGIMDGERDENFRASMTYHGKAVERISPHIDLLDGWCDDKNRENLRTQRTRILATEGLKYTDYFDEDGTAKELKVDEDKLNNRFLRKMEMKRIKCFYKALHVKLTPLSACELTSEGSDMNDPYYFGRTKREYEKQASLSDIISKVAIAVIFGYYGVSLIKDFSYAKLIWNGLQVAIFVLMGFVKMFNSYIFITGEFRGRMVKKVNVLEMFLRFVDPKAKPIVAEPTEERKQEVITDGN